MNNLTLFYGPNAGYVLELYERYQHDPESVDPATRAVFEHWTPTENGTAPATHARSAPAAANGASVRADVDNVSYDHGRSPLDVMHTVGAARLIRYIREKGHLDAHIDPLGSAPPGDPGLRPEAHDVTDEHLRALPAEIVRGPLVAGSANALEGVKRLRETYSGAIGYETDHIQDYEERSWIREAIESQRYFYGMDTSRLRDVLERLTAVEVFERFLHQTFMGQKRFSLEGCDMLVPMLDSIIRNAASVGSHEVVIGMAHRGRLNVLAHVLGKPYSAILAEFQAANRKEGASAADKGSIGWAGDVKYHLGARQAYKDSGIDAMPLTLASNPSHLEFVDPVVEGRARAAQERRDQPGAPVQNEHASLAVLIHGDAAFPGQGIVAETLNLSQLKGYDTGGTIHIITNNQIGFTTDPVDDRSTLYASDLAKGFEIPIVHVNADDPVACIAMARMAHAYREQFGKDFLIDLVGYRRWGHNEGDEPSFTQPLMYQKISEHPTVRAIWAKRLEQEGVIKPGEADDMVNALMEQLRTTWQEVKEQPHTGEKQRPTQTAAPVPAETAVPAQELVALNEALLQRPEGFTPHTRLDRLLQRRREAIEQPGGIDWAHAETLAFAAILVDGTPIRLTGQDAERGTFSQRHLVLSDVETGQKFTPLQVLPQAKASFAVYNSPLSENAVLGFEYGYSAHAPNALVLWEAQFGDFANGAQVIIDQFIVSGRAKWGSTPALVMLLPHGYEGQGPEHSSARIERFLQLAAEGNIRVANCTTSAQYFHLLRRQAALLEREPRPLVVFTPKSLLRHPRAGSSLQDLAEGGFQPVILDPVPRENVAHVSRLVMCSGKVYVDLISAYEEQPHDAIAIARLEQLARFPAEQVQEIMGTFPSLQEVVWLQEEPRNMGAWRYV
ncbi:MAG TPA: 2-oxoglutarate dehydrogenase E1 component, partial [Roseiflexaceae bacterium]|nr:2-oxoglutarate dehydrogenase E1 component [Roseiflexaceae bacterium]